MDGPEGLPPPLDLGEPTPEDAPIEKNTAVGVLTAWTALEALSPQTYRRSFDLVSGDRRRIVEFHNNVMPWPQGRSIPKCQLYYQVPLGAIRMGPATKALVEAFGADEELNPRNQERSVIAAVLVDRNGVPLEEKAVAISSFAWALPEVLKRRSSALGRWVSIEGQLVGALTDVLVRRDRDGNVLPLDARRIDVAYRWLVRQFGLSADLVEPPSFAMKVFHHFKAKGDPEVSLLDSFYLRDLDRARTAVAANEAPEGLARYLGTIAPTNVRDLLADRAAIGDAIIPANIPPVRWPSPGGFPLVTLQQAAVNHARSELGQSEGILAVNGPPGTGKTTLLRDLVAGCVLDRALAMCAFDDPQDAFTPSGQRLALGGNAFLHLYKLHASLKGHEIVVASSNNKAVENVSRELPERGAVGTNTAYLRTLSDHVHGRASAVEPEGKTDGLNDPMDDAEGPEPLGSTWGMIAAVLGNAKNRSAFVQSFWWDQDHGLRIYLQAAKGQSVVREIKDDKGRVTKRVTPAIVRHEAPPDPRTAQANWRKAKKRLKALHADVRKELGQIETIRQLASALAVDRALHTKRLEAYPAVANRASEAAAASVGAAKKRTNADAAMTLAEAQLAQHEHERPGWLARLFRTTRFKAWTAARSPLLARQTQMADRARTALADAHRADTAAAEAQAQLTALEREIADLEARMEERRSTLAPWRVYLGDRFVDDAFFDRGHEAWNLASPWVPDALHQKREAVFEAALAVQRAFMDAAAQRMQHNVGALMSFMQNGVVRPEHRSLLPDLWSSLFAVVPVISTTFASVDRMLGGLGPGGLGWLLIDEAGQAVPQAAVGAIYRAKRTIVVGDPLQIPPVVTLPERLVEAVCDEFGVDPYDWAAPEASTQILADRASRYQASFRGEIEPRRVGAPLLVHRRCQDPMFGVSNAIAYDGQMVHAAGPPKDGPITKALGRSRWFDVDGEAESKWCPKEGEMVVQLLRKLAKENLQDPDLFVISPFRDVANGIRTRLRDEDDLLGALGVDPQHWTFDRIGTIHTVQGREAEAVILLLGAPATNQAGARAWAATAPNILNVAVSRAKQSLYVVGSHGAWSGIGHARTLANALPIAGQDATVGSVRHDQVGIE